MKLALFCEKATSGHGVSWGVLQRTTLNILWSERPVYKWAETESLYFTLKDIDLTMLRTGL